MLFSAITVLFLFYYILHDMTFYYFTFKIKPDHVFRWMDRQTDKTRQL